MLEVVKATAQHLKRAKLDGISKLIKLEVKKEPGIQEICLLSSFW